MKNLTKVNQVNSQLCILYHVDGNTADGSMFKSTPRITTSSTTLTGLILMGSLTSRREPQDIRVSKETHTTEPLKGQPF